MTLILVLGLLLVAIPVVVYIGVKIYQGFKKQKDSNNPSLDNLNLASSRFLYERVNSEQTEPSNNRDKSDLQGIQKQQNSERKNLIKAIETKMKLAQSYEIKQMRKSDKLKAFTAYIEVAKLGCEEALAPLERIAEDLSSKEQRELSQLYKFFKNPQKEQYWIDKAQEVERFDFNH